MLRKIRIGISVVLFALITFYFLDFANILPNSFHRLAHIQFVPAVLSLSIGILIVLIALTLLFGRIYCSTICPMGIWQDVIARISKSVGKKKKRYRYSPAKNILSINGKTNCSTFTKHFVPNLILLTQNKMCILLRWFHLFSSFVYLCISLA